MQIKYIRAKNFLSIGEPIEIDFTKYGNIITIKGENRDQGPNASNGAGKCLGKNTLVMMFDGTNKKVQDIIVGDLLMGDDNTFRTVLSTTKGYGPLYKIKPKNEIKKKRRQIDEWTNEYIVNEHHILSLAWSYKRKNFANIDISVKDWLSSKNSVKTHTSGRTASIDFLHREIKIDPYFLGCWLGDGSKHGPHITTADPEIVEVIKIEAANRNLNVVERIKPNNKAITYALSSNRKHKRLCRCGGKIKGRGLCSKCYWIEYGNGKGLPEYIHNSLLDDLKYYKVSSKVGEECIKHIPDNYKFNTREVRLQVLAGLLDTDGSLSHDFTGYDFINKNKRLACDVTWIARSLGFKANISECTKKDQNGNAGIYYRVYITGYGIPVKIERKKQQVKKLHNNPTHTGKISVEAIGNGEYYGFELDGNHRFLLGDFTVTHNSSIIEVIVYALFGELIKNLNHKEAINIKAKKGLEVEVRFDLGDSSYSIIRKREPSSIEIWKDGVDISKGGKDKQDEINKIIKLNYTAFINVVCFGQHNTKQFLACKASDKRNIAENLLSLDKYNNYCKITKDKLKELQTKLDNFSVLYEKSMQDIDNSEKQIKQIQKQQQDWKAGSLNAIEVLNKEVSKIQLRMSEMVDSSSADNYKKLQEVDSELANKQEQKAKKIDDLNFFTEKMNKLKEHNQTNMLVIKESQYAINRSKKEIDNIKIHSNDLLSKDGGKCPVCYGVVDKSNFSNILKHNEEHIKTILDDLNTSEVNLAKHQNDHKKIESQINFIRDAIDKAKIYELDLNRTIKDMERTKGILSTSIRESASSGLLLLEQQLEYMKDQLVKARKELADGDPYGGILETIRMDLEKLLVKNSELKSEIKGIETMKPYYDFWVKAFGDKGIRSFIIDEIIPILNSRIAYWLQFLVDNKIKLTFDKELEEKIERNPQDGDPFVYNAMSGGEHQRIDLGIALAFAQVMMLTSGTCPSIVCLDEVGTNLDRPGIIAVYNMICELSREKQVLVTTHDPDLLEMLSGHETIKIVKENGYSRVEK